MESEGTKRCRSKDLAIRFCVRVHPTWSTLWEKKARNMTPVPFVTQSVYGERGGGREAYVLLFLVLKRRALTWQKKKERVKCSDVANRS